MWSWRTSRLNQVWNKTRLLGIDGFHLFAAFIRKDSSQSWRDVVVNNARNNAVASSFLLVDKEVGLFQYYGFMGYLREKQIGASWHPTARRMMYGSCIDGSGGDPKKDSDENGKEKKQVARVAFMITSTQRAELSERLGFSADAIKELTPLQASLILTHDVSPDEVDKKLDGLVQEYNDELARQHQLAKLEAEKVAASQSVEAETEQTRSSDQTIDETHDTLLLDGETNRITPIGESKHWYEVVETRVSDGSAIPVALYQSEEEAKLCMDLKQGFSERRAKEKDEDPATTYSIRKTVK